MPSWLAFSNGVLSGTPTSAGPYTFNVQVSDTFTTTTPQLFSLTVGPPPGFTLTSSVSTISIIQGKSNQFSVSASSLAGYPTGVSVTATSPWTGLTVTAPSSITPGSNSSIAVGLDTTLSTSVGNTTVTVNATGAINALPIPVTVVAAQPDFVVSNWTPTVPVVSGGPQSSFTETITPIDGFAGDLAIDVIKDSSLPCSYHARIGQNYDKSNQILTVYISTDGLCIIPSPLRALIQAFPGPSKEIDIQLSYVAPAAPPSFSVQPSTGSIDVGAGSSTCFTTSVIGASGFGSQVAVTASSSEPTITAAASSVMSGTTGALAADVCVSTTPATPTGKTVNVVSTDVNSGTQISSPITVSVHPPPIVTMGEYNYSRTAANTNEYTLRPDNVMSKNFGLLWKYQVDGCVWAHPLYYSFNGLNTVYIATANNSVYAFDAGSNAMRWQAKYGKPGAPPYSGDLNCAGFAYPPPTGIVGTPAIDSGSGIMYFVSQVADLSSPGGLSYVFHAIDLKHLGKDLNTHVAVTCQNNMQTNCGTAGFDIYGTNITCLGGPNVTSTDPRSCYDPHGDPSSYFNASQQLQRPGLLFTGGHVFAGFGGYADTYPWQGYIFSFKTSDYSIEAVRPSFLILRRTPVHHQCFLAIAYGLEVAGWLMTAPPTYIL